jgi:ketosteroid isomerase-like protein
METYRDGLINKFYSSFQKLDYNGMNDCYCDDIVFFDPVFGLLRGADAKAMWVMLCKNARDFSLTYGNIQHLDEEYSTCDWVASYTFSKTGKKVVNKIKANMRFEDGKIAEHSDAFSLHQWSSQALGFMGWLLGWNRFFQRKIQNGARKNLIRFMEKSK